MRPYERLPPQIADMWEWQDQAACKGQSEYFFSPPNERGQARLDREQAAKYICAKCPVLRECRDFALETREQHGTWGGLTEDERDEILGRRRKRQNVQ